LKGNWKSDVALLILRLSGFGLAFAHGWSKVSSLIAGEGGPFIAGVERLGFPLPILFAWLAALAELVGGFAIAFGLLTRIAALFAAFTMFVASFLQHHLAEHVLIFFGLMTPPPEDVVESWRNPERAAVYLLIFLALVFTGGGRFSLDRLIRKGN
jgi:putative oxidoreductase